MEHPTEGKVIACRFPVQFSRSPASIRRLAPNLGEHNAEVLGSTVAPADQAAPEPFETQKES